MSPLDGSVEILFSRLATSWYIDWGRLNDEISSNVQLSFRSR
jgi:hypothetical protein